MDIDLSPQLKSEKASDYVYRILQQNIVDLTLEPGSALNEQELADILKVSRTPVREAIFRLKEEHLMESYPQSRSVVSLLNAEYLNAVVYLRNSVETSLLKTLCSCISSEYVDKLRYNLSLQNVVYQSQNADNMVFYGLDREFHHLLYEAAEQQKLYDMLRSCLIYYDRVSCFLLKFGYHDIGKSYSDHTEWFDIIVSGDTERVPDAVNRHLNKSRRIKEEHLKYFSSVPKALQIGETI